MYFVGVSKQYLLCDLALQEVIRQHPVLRTQVVAEGVKCHTLNGALRLSNLWADALGVLTLSARTAHLAHFIPRLGYEYDDIKNVVILLPETETAYNRYGPPKLRFDYRSFKFECDIFPVWPPTTPRRVVSETILFCAGPEEEMREHIRVVYRR
jgi:hypothetical protein